LKPREEEAEEKKREGEEKKEVPLKVKNP